MFLFTALSLLIVVLSFIDFKKTFVFYCSIKMFALGAMCLKYTSPALSMQTFLNFYFLIAFYSRGYLEHRTVFIKLFPLRNYFVVDFVSIVASVLVTMIPFATFFTNLVMTLVDKFVFPFLFYIMLCRDSGIIRQFIKYSMILFSLAALFGIYEYAVGVNPFREYLTAKVPENLLVGKIYSPKERLGQARICSLFVSPNNMIYGAFISSLAYTYNLYKINKIKYVMPFVFLALAMVFLANSRTVLFSSLVIVMPIFIGTKKSLRYLIIGVVVLIIAFPFLEQYSKNFTSVLSSSEKDEIGGSSVTMRQDQLLASWELFLRSPIVGNGYQSIQYFLSYAGGSWHDRLLGTESIWFKLLIERGCLGIFSYIYMFINMIKRLHVFRNREFVFLLLGYLLANTMSSLPGFSLSYLYITSLMMYKLTKKRKYENRNYYIA